MEKVSLAFAKLNLRWNPFGEPAPEDMADLAVVEVESYVERLKRPSFALQYLGESGRGKSTHLAALHRFFPDMPYLRFPENEEIPRIPHAPVLFLDEMQRVPSAQRRQIFSRRASFAIGSHEDHAVELARAGVQTVSVRLQGITPEHLAQIVERRIEWARRGPGPLPRVSAAKLARLIEEYTDDVAGILARLYEEFQNLEVHTDDGNPSAF